MKIKHFVIFSMSVILIYTIAEFIAGCWGITHDALTPAFFATFGGELLFTCVLKIFEKEKNNDEDID